MSFMKIFKKTVSKQSDPAEKIDFLIKTAPTSEIKKKEETKNENHIERSKIVNEGQELTALGQKKPTGLEKIVSHEEEQKTNRIQKDIAKIFNEINLSYPVDELRENEGLSNEEIFVFAVFDTLGLKRLENNLFMTTLIKFLGNNEITRFKKIEEIRFFISTNTAILKRVWCNEDGEVTFENISFIKDSYIRKIDLETNYTYTFRDSDNVYDFLIEELSPDEYLVQLDKLDADYFTMSKENKNIFQEFFSEKNAVIRSRRNEDKKLIIKKINELDEILNSLIYNFVREIDKSFFLSKYVFICLEHIVGHYSYLGEEFSQLKQEERLQLISHVLEDSNLLDVLYDVKENKFDQLVKIVEKKVILEEKLVPILTWEALKKQVVFYFTDDWIKKYGNYFINVETTIEGILEAYCNINEIENNDEENISYLTYYLMSLQLIDDNYVVNHFELTKTIESKLENKELDLLEKRLSQTYKEKSLKFQDIDFLSGLEFEKFVAELFKKMGYFTVVTKASGDQGIDIIAEKNGRKFGVQTKCYSSKITNTAVQETVAGIVYYNCDRGIVVTNNYFTQSAVQLADKNNIILWNRDVLKAKFEEFIEC